MADKRRKSAGPSKRGTPAERIERTTATRDAEVAARIRARRFGLRSPYLPLLLRAIRDGLVHDWTSLTAFQVQNKLELVTWGTQRVDRPPAVDRLLGQLVDARLVTVEGIDFRRVWVRQDNFTKAPPGRIVYDPHCADPHHDLDSDTPPPTGDTKINVSPRWADIQDALGISLVALAALQSPRARIVEPDIFPEPGPDQEYSDVFVLMPFDEEMRPIFDDHIARVCKELSLSASRADDFFKANAIMADVWGAIQHAKVIVADCTGRNANVFYEMGIAHVLGKPVVLVSQNATDIPFDIRSIRYIPYEYTPRGMKKFEGMLKAAVVASIE